jgi:uncharacterized protein YjbI with pentapeptide repeats
VAGADFGGTNLTASQLYSTASYKAHNLQGIGLESFNLTGWNFSGQNLTNANLSSGTLTNANFTGGNLTGANVAGADFGGTNLTASQLYSTASYKAHNLQGIGLESCNLTGWNFSGQNLTNANLSSGTLTNANLTGANLDNTNLTNAILTGADLRGAQRLVLGSATITNTVLPNGTIQGLHLDSNNPILLVRNYGGNIPIHILQGMSMSPETSLVFQFDGAPWRSTISFDSGIPVTLGGNIELGVASGVDPTSLLGDSFHLFDWSSISPSGQFANVINDLPAGFLWNTSQLYTTGDVTLVPEPSTWKGPGGGSFNLASNWKNGSVPNGVDAIASFSENITAPSTVTLDSPVTLGILNFNSSQSYTLAGTGSVTLQVSSGTASINVQAGNHEISVPVVMNSDTVVSGAGTLDLSGGITGNHSLTVLGTLTATSIQVDTLTIGGAGATAVPEPSTIALLTLAFISFLAFKWQRRAA